MWLVQGKKKKKNAQDWATGCGITGKARNKDLIFDWTVGNFSGFLSIRMELLKAVV